MKLKFFAVCQRSAHEKRTFHFHATTVCSDDRFTCVGCYRHIDSTTLYQTISSFYQEKISFQT
ncbi:hypothetical protein D3C81_1736440 [compost metagenome]